MKAKFELEVWNSNWRLEIRIGDLKFELETWNSNWRFETWIGDLKFESETWNSNWRFEIRIGGLKFELETWNLNWRLEIWITCPKIQRFRFHPYNSRKVPRDHKYTQYGIPTENCWIVVESLCPKIHSQNGRIFK